MSSQLTLLVQHAAAIDELVALEERAAVGELTAEERSRWHELCALLFGGSSSDERRRSFRVRVARSARLRADGAEREVAITSLSVGGLFVQTDQVSSDLIGREVEIELELPTEVPERLQCQARVCWVAEPADGVTAGLGVRFVELPAEHKSKILRHCRQHLRWLLELSSHQYAFFFENSADVAVLLDGAGMVREINARGATLLGTEPAVLEGRPVEALFAEESGPQLRRSFDALERSGRTRLPARLRAAGGRAVRVDVQLVPLTVSGLAMGAILVAHDVADLQLVAEQQRELERRLFQADKLATIGQIAASIAHDINNPLAYVHANLTQLEEYLEPLTRALQRARGAADIATDPPALLEQIEADLGELVTDSLEGGRRIRDILLELRDFSRVDSEGRVRIDVNKAVETSLRVVKNLIKHRAKLVRSLAEGLPETYGSFGRLSQILINLLSNATQAFDSADTSRNQISVRTAWEDERLVIEVSDNGRGISAADMPHILEPFYTTRRDAGGTGLGLAIVKENVDALGGALTVRSEPGQGTSILVRLPPRGPSRPWLGPAEASEPPAAGVARVLVVDDEPALLRSLRRILGRSFHVTVTTSTVEALAIARQQSFSAVVCDVMVPEMDGMHFHEALSRLRPELASRLLFITGGTFSDEEEAELLRLGRPILRKPLEPDALVRAVGKLVEAP